MIKEWIKASLLNTFYMIFKVLPLFILGLIVVPLALLFPNDDQKEATYKRNETTGSEWWIRTLPKWAYLWDNTIDGFLGDDNWRWSDRDIPYGIYDKGFLVTLIRKIHPTFFVKNTDYFGQLLWALRNPINQFKRFILTCDVRECTYELLAGQEYVRDDMESQGWHFLKATDSKGKSYYRYYYVKAYKNKTKAFTAEFGFKFDRSDFLEDYTGREYKAYKGFTFLVNPYKEIG